jgi:N,N-dimethylformamidase
MPAVGYVEPWSVRAGGRTRLHLSSIDDHPTLRIVRLDCEPPASADWNLTVLKDRIEIAGFEQGSWLEIPLGSDLRAAWSISFEFLLTRNTGTRTVLEAPGFRLDVDESQHLILRNAGEAIRAQVPLKGGCWYVIGVYRTQSGTAEVKFGAFGADEVPSRMRLPAVTAAQSMHYVALGSCYGGRTPTVNGRIGRMAALIEGEGVEWSFAPQGQRRELISTSGRGPRIKVHNLPTFSVTSARWNGTALDPATDPSHYDAVHLHDDDTDNYDWDATHEVQIPENAPSGVYAFEVATQFGTERMPFFVRPSQPSARLLFLAPTNTYLAYADEYLPTETYPWLCTDRGHRFAQDNNLRSVYDIHSDHSGVTLTTLRRPKATLRDDYEYPLSNSPHLLPVDLHLLKYCGRNGIEIDIATDYDLHTEGAAILEPYAGIFTGSHPEYWSSQMLGALDRYLDGGGNLAYWGGNGFYLRVAVNEDLMELRRDMTDSIWSSTAGELHLTLTGERGGTWESCGRHPQSLLGNTYLMMSFGPSRPYRRLAESYSGDWAWVFERVADGLIGDRGLVLGGAAGYEVDGVVPQLPTPPSLVRLAEATGFDSSFQVRKHLPIRADGEERERLRRADMTIYRHPGGGLVFSVGSVAWCGALPNAGDQNAVGEITSNIAKRFSERP